MNAPIRVEGLSKMYHIGRRKDSNQTLRDVLSNGLLNRFRQVSRKLRRAQVEVDRQAEILWALKDVSFEIRWGEVVGIIGRNGAGKSTLLKILSRITEPTHGRAEIHGRVGSLLEVGTGFHGELTGRENIYLNGAILGMRRAEINQKFDEIVEFSGVSKFIDTPVKHYSSGMHVRLAFAVAAHLEPEILIVDEALAVGDAAFQNKCIHKMGDVAKGGRTVLLVTHNMGFISTLTERAMILEEGKLTYMGPTSAAIAAYFRQSLPQSGEDLRVHLDRQPGMVPALTSARLRDGSGRPKTVFVTGDEWQLEIEYVTDGKVDLQGAAFNIYTATGMQIGGLSTYMLSRPPYAIPAAGRVVFHVRDLHLCPGDYVVSISLSKDRYHDLDWVLRAVSFTVDKSDVFGNGFFLTSEQGICSFRGTFELEPEESWSRSPAHDAGSLFPAR